MRMFLMYYFIIVDVLSEQPTQLKLKQTSESEVEVTFRKVPNKLVKFYKIHIEGFTIPNVPLMNDIVRPPTTDVDGSRQTETIKDLQSGWDYKITVRAIYGNDEEGTPSTVESISLGKQFPALKDYMSCSENGFKIF